MRSLGAASEAPHQGLQTQYALQVYEELNCYRMHSSLLSFASRTALVFIQVYIC